MKNSSALIILKWGGLLGIGLSALQFVKSIAGNFDYFSFGPILDLLLVVLFIGFLFLGIKEIRDNLQEGRIKFSKAYLTAISIAIVAFIIVFLYLLLYYTFFNRESLNKINEENISKYWGKLEKDTIKNDELTFFIQETENRLNDTKNRYLQDSTIECSDVVTHATDTLFNIYRLRLENKGIHDTAYYRLPKFTPYACRIMMELTESTNFNADSSFIPCLPLFNTIIQQTVAEMQEMNMLQRRFDMGKDKIPQYHHPLAAALYFSLSVLMYGLLFGIFVALYLYRNNKKDDEEIIENEQDGENVENEIDIDNND